MTGAEQASEAAADNTNNPLHHTQVIQHCNQRTKKDNDGQHTKGKNKPQITLARDQGAKHEGDTCLAIIQQRSHAPREKLQCRLSPSRK